MIPIKARYLKHDVAIGKEYTFGINTMVKPGDVVKVGTAKAVVTNVDVTEEEVADYKDKLKIVEKMEEE